jgi:hypothetical protein
MHVRGKITALAAGTLMAACGIPASASAAEPGFTVDPQSPAGVEYQVPLDSARGQGGGGSSHDHGGGGLSGGGGGGSSGGGSNAASSSPILFGSGITPAAGGPAGAKSKSSGGRHHRGGQASGGSGSAAGGLSVPSALSTTASYSSTGPVAGIVGAILLVGGGLGLVLRLRARRPRKIFS